MTSTPHFIATPAGAASRPLVVMLHGIGGRAKAWEPVMRLGQQRGWASLAWDMPGYGHSPAIDPMDFDGLSEALHQLVKDRGRIALVGHSMGGMVALQHAARHASDLAALVLVATSPAFGKADGDFQREFIAQRLAPLQAGRTMSEMAIGLLPQLCAPGYQGSGLALAQACMSSVSPAAYERALRALVQFDQRAALPGIAVPTLCLAAEHDQAAPPAVMSRMASLIPQAQSQCLPGLGHLMNLENPSAFAKAVFDFLETHFP
ncbi:MAG: alpha/beta hydrolase [Pseudomonadota bacterium]